MTELYRFKNSVAIEDFCDANVSENDSFLAEEIGFNCFEIIDVDISANHNNLIRGIRIILENENKIITSDDLDQSWLLNASELETYFEMVESDPKAHLKKLMGRREVLKKELEALEAEIIKLI